MAIKTSTAPRKPVSFATAWGTATVSKVLSPGMVGYDDSKIAWMTNPTGNALGVGRLGGTIHIVYLKTAVSQFDALTFFEDVLGDDGASLTATADQLQRGWFAKKPQKVTLAEYIEAAIERATNAYTDVFRNCGFTFEESEDGNGGRWLTPKGKVAKMVFSELVGCTVGCAQLGSYQSEIEDKNNMSASQCLTDKNGKAIQKTNKLGQVKLDKEGKAYLIPFFTNRGYAVAPINLRRDKRAELVIEKKTNGDELSPADESVLKFYSFGLPDFNLSNVTISVEESNRRAAEGETVPDRRPRPWLDGSTWIVKTKNDTAGEGDAGDTEAPPF
jgi:hypothetical protein